MSEIFPMDFVGAAQSEKQPAINYLLSDEDEYVDRMSTSFIWDVFFSSEDKTEEVAMMAQCIEKQLADPIPIHCPEATSSQKRSSTPRPNLPPSPTDISTSAEIAEQYDAMEKSDNTTPSSYVETWCPKWTPHCRPQPQTED